MRRLIEEVTAAGGSAAEIPKTEVWRLLQAWRQIYCAPFRKMQGPRGSHGWHAFSFGHFPSVRGERALREYRSQEPIDLLVLPDDKHTPGVCFTSDTIVEFSGWDDIYVAPRSFK